MKKEMKHALVALGLSTSLVPTFASQVVYAQENDIDSSNESFYKTRADLKSAVRNYSEQVKKKILKEIDDIDWYTVQFKEVDVLKLKNAIVKKIDEVIEEREENINRFSKRDHYYSSDIEGTINRMKGDMPNSLEYVFDIARIKKFDLLLQQVEKDSNLYSSVEKEKLISDLKSFYGPLTGWSLPRSRHFGDDEPYNDSNLTLKEYVQKLSTFYNKVDKWSPSLIPTEKNIREINAVAFMEKTAISNDDTLSKADKVSMFSKIDDIVEEGIHKIRKEAGLVYKEETVRHMLSPEELSVFTKRIEDVYQGKAKPKVTKEEAIQAVSTGTSSSVSTSSQAIITSNGETKKNHQASKWFKESGKWYYNDLSGNLVRNRWVGRYYLKSDASMAASEWIYDEDYKSWFYVDSTGSYVEKAWQGEYYLKRGGYMAKSEWVFDSQYDSWYYLNQDGKYARNQWIKDGDKWYYLLADGKLAKNMTINGYKVNEKGEWV
ncbi:N-acetylmuramoyl-L-alanine amidase family protein [Streptococcus pseudopneumoniae]|nr:MULTISPECIES: N-acetylmuramoyl-L-alanine amidase family protein [Streptococcus]MBF9679383.1 N-acetylmuramoyl-L-alanine amidase family protein [Streptococcus pseudopneumoniae]MBW8142924.1 N-acetylmuramoyl-L-alanine amidase family protein [Streptococcus pseudopneumoniae]MDS9311685.1 N-acetylmuramoyl-L-alanine amidase family protein [Streptococcus pseudopneumoniae]NIB82395.1 N-acetylmuramoyl-L-alanine amidase family protein [Streptococcus pseudopneumoniae]PLV79523.1 choline-binding protein C [